MNLYNNIQMQNMIYFLEKIRDHVKLLKKYCLIIYI